MRAAYQPVGYPEDLVRYLALLLTLSACSESIDVDLASDAAVERGEHCRFEVQVAGITQAYADAPYGRALTPDERACLAAARIDTVPLDEYVELCPTDPLGACYAADGVYTVRGDTWPNSQPPSQRMVIWHVMTHRLLECVEGDAHQEHDHPALARQDLANRAWALAPHGATGRADDSLIYPCE